MSTAQPDPVRRALHRFGLERDRLRTAIGHALGMTTTELDALEHLEADGPLTQRELGDRLLLTSGGVTVLVDRLERAGMVRRTPHPRDRRALLVRIDPDAAARLPDALAAYHDDLDAAADALPEDVRSALESFLSGATRSAHATVDTLRAAQSRR